MPSTCCVLFLVIFASTAVNSNLQTDYQSHCDRYASKTDDFRFTEPSNGPATLAIGCATQMIELVCCVSKFKTITWYHTTDNGKTWTEFKTNNGTRNLYERNQVASIFEVDLWADRGSYKCVAEGFKSGERLENTVKLDIRNCSSWSKGPVWLNPNQEVTTVEADLGEKVIIPCTSFSGTSCVEDVLSNSFWYKQPDIPIQKNDSAGHSNFDYFCWAGLEMEATLTINGVTEEDFGEYSCAAININDPGTPDRLVILKKKDPANVVVLVNVAIVGGVLLSVAVIGILVTYQRRSDLDFKIWMSSRQMKDEKLSVLLINAEEDRQLAMHLKDILETRLQFTVTSSFEDVLFNEASVSRIPALAEECSCVLVLLTPALLGDGVLLAAIRNIIHQVTPVFVANGTDRNVYANRAGRDGLDADLTVALSVSRPLYWPGVSDGPGGAIDERRPSEGWERRTTDRQANVFWKKLHLSLLKKTV